MNRETGQISSLNSRKITVRSIFNNKHSNSLIVVFSKEEESHALLHVTSILLHYFKVGQTDRGFEILTSEVLEYPSFVELDEQNRIILTFCSSTGVYKFWDLVNYEYLFEIKGTNVSEVKLCPGVILVKHKEVDNKLKVTIVDIKTGATIQNLNLKLGNYGKVTYLEIFYSYILFKQEKRSLKVIDWKKEKIVNTQSDSKIPVSYIFLYKHMKLLGFRGQKIAIWKITGEVETERFEDHILPGEDVLSTSLSFTSQQDVVISCCLLNPTNSSHCTVNFSEIRSGRLIGKIDCFELGQLTTVSYCETRNEVFVGNSAGQITVYNVK
ncbi:hypothetical protein ABK040_001122 [Willaertia magna]